MEYLIPSDNFIVIDWLFNSTNLAFSQNCSHMTPAWHLFQLNQIRSRKTRNAPDFPQLI